MYLDHRRVMCPSLFMYDATGTTFNGISGDNTTSQSDAIDLSSCFVRAINPNPYGYYGLWWLVRK